MAITKSGTIVTVEYQAGDPKGDTSNPNIMDDVVAASVAGGWSPAVTKQGSCFYMPYNLTVQTSTTFFEFNPGEVIEFDTDTNTDSSYSLDCYTANVKGLGGNNPVIFRNIGANQASKYARLRHTDFDEAKFISIKGIHYYGDNCTNIEFYGCDLLYLPQISGVVTASNLVINDSSWSPAGNFLSVSNITLRGTSYLYTFIIPPILDLSNIKSLDNNYIYFRPYNSGTINLHDSAFDLSNSLYLTFGSDSGEQYCYNWSTFNITITDGNGGTAKLYDKDNNLIFSETLSGTLSKEVTFQSVHIKATSGVLDDWTISSFGPFKLVVSKTGYSDLEIPDISVTAGEQTDIYGQMEYLPLEVSSLSFTNCSNEVSKDGTIIVSAQGGSGSYNYSKDGGVTWQASGSFTGLAEGDYNVKIKDTTTTDEIEAGTITISSEKMYISGIDGTIEEEVINGTIVEEVINGELVEEIINGTIE